MSDVTPGRPGDPVRQQAEVTARKLKIYERWMVFFSAMGIVTMFSASILVLLTLRDPLATRTVDETIEHLALAPYFFFGFCPSWVVQTVLLWWSQRLGASRTAAIIFNWILFGIAFVTGIIYAIFNISNYTLIKANFPTNPLETREKIQQGKIWSLVFLGIGFGAFFPLVYTTLHPNHEQHIKVSFLLLAVQNFLFFAATLLLCVLQIFIYSELGKISTAYVVISSILLILSAISLITIIVFIVLAVTVGRIEVAQTSSDEGVISLQLSGGREEELRPISAREAEAVRARGQAVDEIDGQWYAITTLTAADVERRRRVRALAAPAPAPAPPTAATSARQQGVRAFFARVGSRFPGARPPATPGAGGGIGEGGPGSVESSGPPTRGTPALVETGGITYQVIATQTGAALVPVVPVVPTT